MGSLEDFELSPEARRKLKDKKYLKKALKEGKTVQEIIGFSHKVMRDFYLAAYQLFEKDCFADAARAFLFLVTLNPRNHEYWIGLGMSSQMCKDFEGAIDAYEMAAMMEINDPVPYFYLAKCLFALHERESVISALDLAIECAGDDETYLELKEQAIAARKLILSDNHNDNDELSLS